MPRTIRIDDIENNLTGCVHCNMVWDNQKGMAQSKAPFFHHYLRLEVSFNKERKVVVTYDLSNGFDLKNPVIKQSYRQPRFRYDAELAAKVPPNDVDFNILQQKSPIS